MDSSGFVDAIFKDINIFRENPNSLTKRLGNVKLAMSRFKGNDQVVKDIDNYLYFLKTAIGVKPVVLNTKLCEAAVKELEIIKGGDFSFEVDQKNFEGRVEGLVHGYTKVSYVADQGAEDPAYIIGKILFNKKDVKKRSRKVLLDEDLKYVGIAHKVIAEENTVVMVFVDNIEEPQPVERKDRGNVDELKLAFDYFDVNKIGKIDIRETLGAMKSLQFDRKNPTLYEVMQRLDKKGKKSPMIDFETFVDHILENIEDTESEEGLRRIFELFVDDPNSDTITLATLKRICKELGEKTKVEELKEMMERSSVSGSELTFQEFYDFMTTKYYSREV